LWPIDLSDFTACVLDDIMHDTVQLLLLIKCIVVTILSWRINLVSQALNPGHLVSLNEFFRDVGHLASIRGRPGKLETGGNPTGWCSHSSTMGNDTLEQSFECK
jgi:hypothetical protein